MEIHDQIVLKSALAKLLATEDISVRVDPRARTASFDTHNRVLRLPIWKDISNELYDMLLVHEVGHALDTPNEGWNLAIPAIAEKVLGSKGSRQIKSAHHFLNVVEDARIDKRQMRRYPGSKRDYLAGYAELRDRNFLDTAGKDLNSFNFIDRFNIYFKGGKALGIKFNDIEAGFIKEAENLETWDQTVELTERVLEYGKAELQAEKMDLSIEDFLREALEKFEDKPADPAEPAADDIQEVILDDSTEESEEDDEESDEGSDGGEDGEAADEGIDGEAEGDDEPVEAPVEPNQVNNDEGANDEAFGDEEDNEAEADSNSDNEGTRNPKEVPEGQGSSGSSDDDVPESYTDTKWGSAQEELVGENSDEFIYLKFPKPILKNIICDYPEVARDIEKHLKPLHSSTPEEAARWMAVVEKQFLTWKMNEKDSISYMIKEFDMRKAADEYYRTATARTGKLDMNKLHSYKYSDNLFLNEEVVSDGKDHGFVMFIDWSSSMAPNLAKTVKQLISLIMFCKQTQIPFEVYSFRDKHGYDAPPSYTGFRDIKGPSFEQMDGEPGVNMPNFLLRNYVSSRMNNVTLNKALLNLWIMGHYSNVVQSEPMGGTPLNATIYVAPQIINDFKIRTGVQVVNTIILTDGDSNPTSVVNVPGYNPNRHFFVTDPETKRTYPFQNDTSGSGSISPGPARTQLLLNILKDRTGCNLVGFYLYEVTSWGRVKKNALKGILEGTNLDRFKKKFFDGKSDEEVKAGLMAWYTDAFVAVESAGYDKYFILDSNRMGGGTQSLAATHPTDKAVKTKDVIKEVMETSKNKIRNRSLLKQFISLIAT